jgi:hypothetical protein
MSVITADDLRTGLVGAWRLESYEAHSVDGSDVFYPLGTAPQGIIMYTPDGYMSATLMNPDREPFNQPDPHQAPADELAAAAAGYLSYAGPFTTEDGVVAHHIRVSLMPNWIGGIQYRSAQLDGSMLTLGPTRPTLMGGQLRNAKLVWRRT